MEPENASTQLNKRKALSANTLFHFTKYDSLFNIIREKRFIPRYCLDRFGFSFENEPNCAIPMACFCDIPLTQVGNHINEYGEYAIGLSKDWGFSHGINPVLYCYSKSCVSIATNIVGIKLVKKKIENELIQQRELTQDDIDHQEIIKTFIYAALFNKPYKGQSIKSGKEVVFYDEREWRGIPPLPEFNRLELPLCLTEEQFKDHQLVESYQKKLATNCYLAFQPDDIRYVIVSRENEIPDTIDMVDKTWPNGSGDAIKRLQTRITSFQRIYEDY